ncbi:MAG TPA: transcription termination factor NusA [Gemmatales bacterium]|nr:transcription termination factor NusA [Gemmatales bacterium]
MNGPEVLRIVDAIHRDKNIPKEIIFEGIESALLLAARKHFNEAEDVSIHIDRDTGFIDAKKGEVSIDPEVLGRIAAQSAKQVMIQKIREAECSSVFDDYVNRKGELVIGSIQRIENGSALVSIGNRTEAFLPRSEMIPGETPHVGQRIKAIILDVRKIGNRVRIVLSRTHRDFVRRLFEQEIPEIADRTITIRSIAREAGYRTKIAASSIDQKVDAVGACVGVRGSRIKNIIDELGGERIDIVRWNESLQVMIPNALQPAQIEEIMLYPRLGRAIVLVKEDQLSLAIGRRGQNVRLASKLVGWDIEIMTTEELEESIVRAEGWFHMLPGVTDELIEAFIGEGFLSYDDLTFLEASEMGELFGIDEELANTIITVAEAAAEAVEAAKERARARGGESDEEQGAGTAPAGEEGSAAAADAESSEATDASGDSESAIDDEAVEAAMASLESSEGEGPESALALADTGHADEPDEEVSPTPGDETPTEDLPGVAATDDDAAPDGVERKEPEAST